MSSYYGKNNKLSNAFFDAFIEKLTLFNLSVFIFFIFLFFETFYKFYL